MSSWRNILGGFGGGQPLARDMGVPSSGGSANPGTGPDGMNAGQLQPNTRAANMEAGVPYQFVPSYPPFVRLANSPDIIYFPRVRILKFFGNGIAINTQVTQQYTFSVPTIIIARTAAAFDASGGALPIGRDSLDTFEVQFFRTGSTNDLLDAGAGNAGPQVTVIGSAVMGNGGLPGFIPCNGLFVDVGGILNVTAVSRFANISVDIAIHTIEEWGPARG